MKKGRRLTALEMMTTYATRLSGSNCPKWDAPQVVEPSVNIEYEKSNAIYRWTPLVTLVMQGSGLPDGIFPTQTTVQPVRCGSIRIHGHGPD